MVESYCSPYYQLHLSMIYLKFIFFSCVLLIFTACNQNPSDSRNQPDSSSKQIKHEDLHDNSHDTANILHTGDKGLGDIIPDMQSHLKNIHKTNNIDRDFISAMNILHQAELEMAYMELTTGKIAELKKIAQEIKNNEMFSKLKVDVSITAKADSEAFYKELANYLKNISRPKIAELRDIDSQFANYLKYHHQISLGLMQILLKFSRNEEVKSIVSSIQSEYETQLLELGKIQTI